MRSESHEKWEGEMRSELDKDMQIRMSLVVQILAFILSEMGCH